MNDHVLLNISTVTGNGLENSYLILTLLEFTNIQDVEHCGTKILKGNRK